MLIFVGGMFITSVCSLLIVSCVWCVFVFMKYVSVELLITVDGSRMFPSFCLSFCLYICSYAFNCKMWAKALHIPHLQHFVCCWMCIFEKCWKCRYRVHNIFKIIDTTVGTTLWNLDTSVLHNFCVIKFCCNIWQFCC